MTWLALIVGLACVPFCDPVTRHWLRERWRARLDRVDPSPLPPARNEGYRPRRSDKPKSPPPGNSAIPRKPGTLPSGARLSKMEFDALVAAEIAERSQRPHSSKALFALVHYAKGQARQAGNFSTRDPAPHRPSGCLND